MICITYYWNIGSDQTVAALVKGLLLAALLIGVVVGTLYAMPLVIGWLVALVGKVAMVGGAAVLVRWLPALTAVLL